MKTKLNTVIGTALLCVVFTIGLHAQGTAFTYQGRLQANGSPANGNYDLRFTIYDLAAGGTAIAKPQTNSAVVITNGLFTVTLDFSNQFPGADRWLEIGVRTNNPANPASFVTLSPRQKLTPTPYAITAGNVVSGGLPATYSSAVNFNNAANSFTGSGAGLTSLNASSLTSGTVSDTRLSANVALLDRNQTFTGNQTFAGQLILPSPVATIYSGSDAVLHSDENSDNFFAGPYAGNLLASGNGDTASGDYTLHSVTSGSDNTAIGYQALAANATSSGNTAIGTYSLSENVAGYDNTASGYYALSDNRSGIQNTADGVDALIFNTIGNENTANGFSALYFNINGGWNTASGAYALYNNTSGSNNVANGNEALYSNTNGYDNTANGAQALQLNTDGYDNTGNGADALQSNKSGFDNTAEGAQTLQYNTDGYFNTANGAFALLDNISGTENTANGDFALLNNQSGNDNTANGFEALYSNTNSDNTANGAYALYADTSGNYNTASGGGALISNTSGSHNTADGALTLQFNTTGNDNVASGYEALYSSTNGEANVANGYQALYSDPDPSYSTAIGYQALYSSTGGSDNTAVGYSALYSDTSGSYNIALGNGAGELITTGDNNIDIGNFGQAGDSDTIKIGDPSVHTNLTFIAGIYGETSPSGVPVYVSASGHLGTLTSSRRFKQNIQNMGNASDVLYSLDPVTFQYKPGIDPHGTPQFGLVAEQVEKVDPALVVLDKTGEPYTVRYQAVNAMLLNEFLKEHHTVQEQGTEIQQLRHAVAQLKDLVNQMAEGRKGEAQ